MVQAALSIPPVSASTLCMRLRKHAGVAWFYAHRVARRTRRPPDRELHDDLIMAAVMIKALRRALDARPEPEHDGPRSDA